MDDRTLLGRREFTVEAAMALLSGVAITVSGCGGSTSAAAPSPPPQGDVTGSISGNHGHSAVITRAQLTAAGELMLDIQGTADHPHTLALGPGHVTAIASGQQVTVNSTGEQFHSHSVTFN
jgi:hypothetical protein